MIWKLYVVLYLIITHTQLKPSRLVETLRVWGFNDFTAISSTGEAYFQLCIPGNEPVIHTGAD